MKNFEKEYEKKLLRGKQLTEYKDKLQQKGFTQIQKDVLFGTLLGDASMQAMKGNQKSNIKFEQKVDNKDYIFHLYEMFEPWVGTPPRIRNIKGGGAKDRQSIWFKTYRHPSFDFYKSNFYTLELNAQGQTEQRKKVPRLIHRWLTPRALAYWFMDDGSRHAANYSLNSQGFTYQDQIILAKALASNYGFAINIWKDRTKYKLAILACSKKAFKDLIEPYILPCFRYKL